MSFMRFKPHPRQRGWKRILPRTLFGRALLILVLPTLLVQGISTYMFYQRHWDNVRKHMALSLAREIAFIARQTEHFIAQEPLHTVRHPGLSRIPLAAITVQDYASMFAGQFFLQAQWLPKATLEQGPPAPPVFPYLAMQLAHATSTPFELYRNDNGDILVKLGFDNGVLAITASIKRIASATTYIFILWMLGAAFFFTLIAVIFLRNQIRPIQQLADAAEQFGKGQSLPQFRPRGALEVRRAALAFQVMSERIIRQMAKRTRMLAAISHDLRTPLTRMKLQLALMSPDDDARKELESDIHEMEALISEYLDFIRGEGQEKPVSTVINELVDDIAHNYRRMDKPLHVQSEREVTLPLRPNAFRRCLSNLIDNAFRHGTEAWLEIRAEEHQLVITLDDDGPGIPEGDRDKVWQAFRTLDESRHRDESESHDKQRIGLGMSIAKDVILSHGGTIDLAESPQKGLRVRIRIPL